MFLPLLAVAALLIDARADIMYAGEWHRGDPEPFQEVVWRRIPSTHDLAGIVPRGKTGSGYAHLRCASLARSGKFGGCTIAASQSGDGIPADPDFDRAGLRAMSFYRATREMSHDPRRVDFVSIALRFYIDGREHGLGWGDCIPFCVIDLPFSSVPPTPSTR